MELRDISHHDDHAVTAFDAQSSQASRGLSHQFGELGGAPLMALLAFEPSEQFHVRIRRQRSKERFGHRVTSYFLQNLFV